MIFVGVGCKKGGSFNLRQSSPEPLVESKSAGHDSFAVVQSLTNPKVDVLVVIDTSGSMEHHQRKLGDRFGQLVSSLQNIDWQMAFINSDDSTPLVEDDGYHGVLYNLEDASGEIVDENGDRVNILTAQLENPQDLFLNTIDRSGKSARLEGDSGVEVPLRNIKNAIGKRNNENAGFFRDGSTLVVIALSNEDEMSTGQPIEIEGGKSIHPTQPSEVTDAVHSAFGLSKKFFTYGIIVQPEDTRCLELETTRSGRESPTYGTFIHQLAEGKTYNICENDYSDILTKISDSLQAILNLSEIPFRYENVIEESISLTFIPEENHQTGRFDASSNSYVFDEEPADGTRIQIEYSYQK